MRACWRILAAGSVLAATFGCPIRAEAQAAPSSVLVGSQAPERPGLAPGQPVPADLDSLTQATLDSALEYLAIDRSDLGFEKRYVEDDTFRLAVVDLLLEDPLAIPRWQSAAIREVRARRDDPLALLDWIRAVLESRTGGAWSSEAGSSEAGSSEARSSEGRSTEEGAAGSSSASGRMALLPAMTRTSEWPSALASARPPGGDSSLFTTATAAFIASTRESEQLLERAFHAITPEERNHLLAIAPAFFGEPDHPTDRLRKGMLHFELGATTDTTFEQNDKRVLDAAARLDRRALHLAARRFVAGLLDLTAVLSRVPDRGSSPDGVAPPWPSEFEPLAARIEGDLLAVASSPWGWILFGGQSGNRYPAEVIAQCAVVIDAGGDDIYEGRSASAVGDLLRPFGAVVDLGGDDVYRAENKPFALGGAVLGVAVLIDTEGDDLYRGDDGSLGAGFFGVGILQDGAGRDILEGRCFTQGAGAFGIGYLGSGASATPPPGIELQPDRAFALGMIAVPGTGAIPVRNDENDTYTAARLAQGFAGTYGLGILDDVSGNDLYRAGGHYLHAPLLPHDFQSLAQGFSIGSRSRAGGGIGILLDEQGNDFYDAEVYAQGTSYWYSLGILFDGGGNDRYLAAQYAQGAGVHLSVGSLWDRGGDDQYISKHGVVQGTAHDLAVGVFWDESGNDSYSVTDGQGISLTNAVAVFVDGQGDDIYGSREGQGVATWRRGFSGAAVFLDLEGRDAYPAERAPANGASWANSDFAVGIDLDRDLKLPDEEIPEIVLTAADSARAVAELFETASLWEVGSAREKVRRARKALIAKGMEAVRYAAGEEREPAYEHGEPLTSDDGLVYRTIEELAKAYPDSFTARILPRARDPHLQVQRNVITLLGDLERADARPLLESMLRDRAEEKHWVRILEALGKIGDAGAAPALRPFLKDEDERRRIQATAALKALRDTTSVSRIVDLLADPEMSVRSAALSAVVAFGGASVPDLIERVPRSDPAELLPVTQGLAKILPALADTASATQAARARVREALLSVLEEHGRSDEPGRSADTPPHDLERTQAACRAAAAVALWPDTDATVRSRIEEAMAHETDPFVIRAYRRVVDRTNRAG